MGEGWTIEQLPEKLRACIDGDYRHDEHDLMRQAADEIERLRQWSRCGNCGGELLPTCVECGTKHNGPA
jgi:hypothetical protein